MKNINNIIEDVSKRNLVKEQPFHFKFKDKYYHFKLYRHYDKRNVSLCNRNTCNAGDDCCHYTKVKGVGLCCTLSSNFTLRVSRDMSHLFAQGIDSEDEDNMINFAQNILDAIGGVREVEKMTKDEIKNMVRWE